MNCTITTEAGLIWNNFRNRYGCVLTARIVTSTSWHIMPYKSFGTACCLHHQNSNIFSAQLTLSGHPWKWRQKMSPNLGTYTLIRMRCHILRDTYFFVSLGGHTCVAITIHAFMNEMKSSLACSRVGWHLFNWFSHGEVSKHKPCRCHNHFTSNNGILWRRE